MQCNCLTTQKQCDLGPTVKHLPLKPCISTAEVGVPKVVTEEDVGDGIAEPQITSTIMVLDLLHDYSKKVLQTSK